MLNPLSGHLLFCLVLLLAAATQTLTGFGFAFVALGLLGLWMDLHDAILLVAPAGLVLNATLFFKLRKEFSLEGVGPLFLACFVGVPVGVWLVLNTESRGLRLLMAVVMIGTAAHRVWMLKLRRVSVWHPWKAGVPCGFLSGVLGGAFGAGGPPVVSYLVNRPINRFRYVATVQVAAAIASSVRLVQFSLAGHYDREDVWLFLPSVLSVLVGVFIGMRLLKKISDDLIGKAVLAFLFLVGVYYLLQG